MFGVICTVTRALPPTKRTITWARWNCPFDRSNVGIAAMGDTCAPL